MLRKCAYAAPAAALVLAASFAGRASAAVIPYTQLDQSRTIEVAVSARANAFTPPLTDGAQESSNAIGPFFRTMDYQVVAHEPPPGLNGSTAEGSAAQNVVFGDTAIFGNVSARAHVTHSGGSSSALANSQFNTHFTVAQDTPFTLAGQITMSSSGLGTTGRYSEIFVLSAQGPQPGQAEMIVTVASAGGNGGGTYALDAAGVFHPGWTYTLNVQLLGEKTTEGGGAGADKLAAGRADFVLTVPEPAGLAAAFVAAAMLFPRRRRVA
jgi:hypothetical protein